MVTVAKNHKNEEIWLLAFHIWPTALQQEACEKEIGNARVVGFTETYGEQTADDGSKLGW